MDINLLKQLGNMDQLAGVRRSTTEYGLKTIEIYNAAGLRYTLLADRCLDIYDFSYKGVNVAYHTKNGMHAGLNFNALGDEFFSYWSAGMLATCGLASSGVSCVDDTGIHPIHGRIGYRPANNVSVTAEWREDDYVLEVSGEMAETRFQGRDLRLKRTISTGLYSKRCIIRDTITNYGNSQEEFMLLYHFNFGYPLLSPDSRFVCTPGRVQQIVGDKDGFCAMGKPVDGAEEKLYVHMPETGRCHAGLINPGLGMGAYIEFDAKPLPVMLEWKNMRSHDYALGIEPCNCFSKGRVAECENGTIPSLPPYESAAYDLTLGVIEAGELAQFEQRRKQQDEGHSERI